MANIYNMTDTWTDGSTLTSIKMNVTDTSSAADSKLLDLQVGGSSKLTVGKDGAITAVQAGSVIPFYYDSQGLFPSAGTYHGAVAHSHNDGAMYFAHGGNWLKLVNANTSGNVGIGTSSPTGGKLQIETTAEPGLFVKDTGNTAAPYVRVQGLRGDANRFSSFSGGLALEAYRSDDKIPNDKQLGTIYFGGNHTNGTEANISYAASISGVADGAFNSVTNMPTAIAFNTGSSGNALGTANTIFGTERMRIGSDGKVYIARTNTISGYSSILNLDHNGGVYYGIMLKNTSTSASNALSFINSSNSNVGAIAVSTSSTTYSTSSDYRLKENVVDLTSAIERLKLIPVHRFNFIADPDTTVDGFLAHEVQPHVPEAVHGEKDAVDSDGNMKSQMIDQSKLVPLLTAAIKEQQVTIEALEARIAALESA